MTRERWEQILFAHVGDEVVQDMLNEYVLELESSNDKLRELAVLQSVIFKHMSTCSTTDCQVCPVKEECSESVHLEGLLGIDDKETSWLVQWRSEDAADVRAKNAKLRELADAVKEFVEDTHCEDCPRRRDCDDNNSIFCANDFSYHAFATMRELEVEAE